MANGVRLIKMDYISSMILYGEKTWKQWWSIHMACQFIWQEMRTNSLFGWLVADDWYWFVLREKYCWLVADG
jgi:hypothetical protein